MKNKFLVPETLSWFFACVAVISTALCSLAVLKPVDIADLPKKALPEREYATAERLRGMIAARQSIPELSGVLSEAESDSVVNRPAVLIRALIITDKRRTAVIAVEGSAKSRLVNEGDSVGALRVERIWESGIECSWRGEKYFVPMD